MLKYLLIVTLRCVLGVLCMLSFGQEAIAQISDMPSAVNKAGRERMLSQRMAKAYFQVGQGIDTAHSQQIMDSSIALFDRQLTELKAYAPTPEVREIYARLEQKWSQYKEILIGKTPNQESARQVLDLSDAVLELAQQGTVAYEKESGESSARLVNKAGRERMLSQRMAKFYQAAGWGIEVSRANAELERARSEFLAAMEELRASGLNSREISEQIQLAEVQWVFFDQAVKTRKDGDRKANETTVAASSELILQVMDTLTGLYEKVGSANVANTGGVNEKMASRM